MKNLVLLVAAAVGLSSCVSANTGLKAKVPPTAGECIAILSDVTTGKSSVMTIRNICPIPIAAAYRSSHGIREGKTLQPGARWEIALKAGDDIAWSEACLPHKLKNGHCLN